ncbi:MAG: YsnF/AvaK domain-containing protein [Chloroflexi bacterium]|nr:YsnF/AvaK domain-containing protein [Chloroflexota bacterium]
MGTVVGLFQTRPQADRAVDALMHKGFERREIGIVARGREGVSSFDRDYKWDDDADMTDEGHATPEGGAMIGGITGLLIGAGALLIPGIGPVFAAGPLAAGLGALLGAAAGATIGGIAGGLIQAGVPEEDARYYEDRIRQGGFLVTVDTSREAEVRQILMASGAEIRGLESTGELAGAAPARMMAASGSPVGMARPNPPHGQPGHVHVEDERDSMWESREAQNLYAPAPPPAAPAPRQPAVTGDTVQLKEEELLARKQAVSAGQLEVRKEVVTEQRSIDVPVTREEVVIERHPVDRRPAERPITPDSPTGSIRVPVMEEQVTLEKRPVVVEEISVGKRTVQETETVSGTVRREEAVINRVGDATVSGTPGVVQSNTSMPVSDTTATPGVGWHGSSGMAPGNLVDKDDTDETMGGAIAGGLSGGVAGGALAGAAAGGLTGPAGAAIGAAVGAVGGALAGKGIGETREQDRHDLAGEGTTAGALAGGTTGAVVGTAMAGPAGTVARAAIGGALGAATGGAAGGEVREDWDTVAPEFRSNWQSRYGTSGRTWDLDEPGYRYGWESAGSSTYRGREFDDVDSDLERGWRATKHGANRAWNEVKENAREAWHEARRAVR